MKIIGLTGGIGTGKSTVAQFLAELGAVVIDVDQVGHQALKPESRVYQEIVNTFGEQVLAPDGTIDRRKLGKIVFANPGDRTRLNEIIHPAMHQMVMARLEEHRRQDARVVVLDAPLLLDAGWAQSVDEVWVTTAAESTVLERLRERSSMSAQKVQARIHSQLPSEERIKQADVVIDTDCDLNELKNKVRQLWRRVPG